MYNQEKDINKNKILDPNKFDLKSYEVDELVNEIELIKRRKIVDSGIGNYEDPLNNVNKISTNVNHLIIGRRGSGKTSLLLKAKEILNSRKNLLIFIDLQNKRNKNKSEITCVILEKVFDEILKDINSIPNWKPINERIKKDFFKRISRRIYKLLDKSFNWDEKTTQIDNIYYLTLFLKDELSIIINTNSESKISTKVINKITKSTKDNFETNFESSIDINQIPYLKNKSKLIISRKTEQEESSSNIQEIATEISYSKEEALSSLQENIIELIKIYFEFRKTPILIFLDDFYQIKIENQPFIINYLHEISKENQSDSFSFKLCLVPNRYKLNFDNERILSHKDDFTSVILDRDFDDYESNKDLLIKILCGVKPELKLNKTKIEKLFNDSDVLQKVIIASAYSPRNFLDFFVLMIRFSKAENYPKINSKVFPDAINELRRSKDELIHEEADLSEQHIKKLLLEIENEIVENRKTNFVLYPKNEFDRHEKILITLFNLGYLHRVKEVESTSRGIFVPIFIDMTFTHGVKTFPKGFKQVKFWERRKYNPDFSEIWNFSDELINSILIPLN